MVAAIVLLIAIVAAIVAAGVDCAEVAAPVPINMAAATEAVIRENSFVDFMSNLLKT